MVVFVRTCYPHGGFVGEQADGTARQAGGSGRGNSSGDENRRADADMASGFGWFLNGSPVTPLYSIRQPVSCPKKTSEIHSDDIAPLAIH